jgi:Domain of unknown function (DUF4389)
MDDDLKANVSARSTWLRALYMILFGVAFYLAELVLAAVAVVQFLFALFAGHRLEPLAAFGAQLAVWLGQVVSFLTFASEAKPFPFTAWPDARPDDPEPDEPTFL